MERAVWIVHGEAQARAALARAAGRDARPGPPQLEAFPAAPAPGAIVLHVPLAADAALAFAHAASARHPRARWLVAADPGLDARWLREALAGLRWLPLAFPLQPAALQLALRRALAPEPAPLSARRRRDALVAHVARVIGDVPLPGALHGAAGHLTLSGERGTGKLALARTLHALWDASDGEGRASFTLWLGAPDADLVSLEARLAAPGGERLVVCVEDPAALPARLQRELAGWIELGAPGTALDPTRLLWVLIRPESFGALAPLEPALAELCEGPALRLPPLRERPGAALRLAEHWLRDHAAARGEPARALAESARAAIDADPWPGNARELEAALRRAVASGDGALEAEALGLAPAPPGAAAAVQSALDELPRAGDAREFASVIEELDAARADEAAGEDYATRRDAEAPRRSRSAEVVDAVLGAPASDEPLPPSVSDAALADLALSGADAASVDAAARELGLLPRDETAPRAQEPAASATAATPSLPPKTAGAVGGTAAPAAVAPPVRPASSSAAPDLRAFARAAARELAPALDALRARASEPAAALVTRRLARLEQFADLEADARARTEVAPLLAALLAERRDELLGKRVLVLRELESDDTHAHGGEPALRFAFAAVLDTLLEGAPPRSDLYASARATLAADARPIVRASLRLRSARTPDVALDLALARDLLTRLGATLTLETDATETRATIDLPRD